MIGQPNRCIGRRLVHFRIVNINPDNMKSFSIEELINELQGTVGARKVRLNFNPSEKEVVSIIKIRSAQQINAIEDIRIAGMSKPEHADDVNTWCIDAIKAQELAAMYAVKAATA